MQRVRQGWGKKKRARRRERGKERRRELKSKTNLNKIQLGCLKAA